MSGSEPAGVVVRAARAADVRHLPAVEVAAGARFREVGMDAVADDDPPDEDTYTTALDAGLLWVAVGSGDDDEPGAAPFGYAWAVDLDGQPHLEQLSVHPDHQGLGVGTALLDAVVAWATGTGLGSLTLSTFRDVEWNGPWYARRGFVTVPTVALDARLDSLRHHEAERGLDVDARVVMRLALPPV